MSVKEKFYLSISKINTILNGWIPKEFSNISVQCKLKFLSKVNVYTEKYVECHQYSNCHTFQQDCFQLYHFMHGVFEHLVANVQNHLLQFKQVNANTLGEVKIISDGSVENSNEIIVMLSKIKYTCSDDLWTTKKYMYYCLRDNNQLFENTPILSYLLNHSQDAKYIPFIVQCTGRYYQNTTQVLFKDEQAPAVKVEKENHLQLFLQHIQPLQFILYKALLCNRKIIFQFQFIIYNIYKFYLYLSCRLKQQTFLFNILDYNIKKYLIQVDQIIWSRQPKISKFFDVISSNSSLEQKNKSSKFQHQFLQWSTFINNFLQQIKKQQQVLYV
ncbi:unnamed protein product [Paramecium pentaurelia]|uniref:Uncharacterized protein n=1 Tax=Paramecium pentaurelia TaxID=43138 RepID=A0A8S1YGS3_9CILI|nr:unnamed protein product [Paramecium pentaurelia]